MIVVVSWGFCLFLRQRVIIQLPLEQHDLNYPGPLIRRVFSVKSFVSSNFTFNYLQIENISFLFLITNSQLQKENTVFYPCLVESVDVKS